jgi:hypothetical protein
VSLVRRRFAGGLVPADKLLDQAEATVSRGARELCCRVNAGSRSFARAARDLKAVAQLQISSESLRRIVEREGKRVLQESEAGALKPAWRASDCQVKTPAGRMVSRMYLGVDGFMVPVLTDQEKQARRKQVTAGRRKRGRGKPKLPALRPRKKGQDQRWKEFKLIQYHDQDMGHRLLSVTRKKCSEAGRIMRRDAGRIGFEQAEQRIANVDGAAWIVHQITRFCLLLSGLGLDFFHLAEHVNAGGRSAFGEQSEEGRQWARELLHTLKHEGYEPFWEKLLAWRGRQRTKAGRSAADALLHYVSQRREMIQYPLFQSRGWRIGSSPTESMCGTIPKRIKGPGKRWDSDNAEAVMALEAMEQSRLWETYWTSRAAENN